MMESTAITLFNRLVWAPSTSTSKSQTRTNTNIIRPLCRVAGYMWVLCWFHVTSWPFIKAYAGVRMQDWQVPYSVVGKFA